MTSPKKLSRQDSVQLDEDSGIDSAPNSNYSEVLSPPCSIYSSSSPSSSSSSSSSPLSKCLDTICYPKPPSLTGHYQPGQESLPPKKRKFLYTAPDCDQSVADKETRQPSLIADCGQLIKSKPRARTTIAANYHPVDRESVSRQSSTSGRLSPLSPCPSNSSNNGQHQVHTSKAPTCNKCRNHNILALKKNHKKECPFEERGDGKGPCYCAPCQLIDERRKEMASDISHKREQEQLQKGRLACLVTPLDSDLSSSGHVGEGNNRSRRQTCNKCRNHGKIRALKGHKRFCDYKDCPCQRCEGTTKRQRVMKKNIALSRLQSLEHERADKEGRTLEPLPKMSWSERAALEAEAAARRGSPPPPEWAPSGRHRLGPGSSPECCMGSGPLMAGSTVNRKPVKNANGVPREPAVDKRQGQVAAEFFKLVDFACPPLPRGAAHSRHASPLPAHYSAVYEWSYQAGVSAFAPLLFSHFGERES